MSAESRDYIVLTGTKELLDYIDWKDNLKTPWSEEEWAVNKPIIREYLEYVYGLAQKKTAA